MKCTIHSSHGSIMVIPREANMVRLYIQIASSTDPDFNPRKTATPEEVQDHAKKIFAPYYITWDTVEWYSVYPIGQGIAERYTLDSRVFMGGDACHTHSPKAGQGMNAAFLDAQNLSWKIHLVESGFARRDILTSYESERKHIAENLLDFDARYAKLFSSRVPVASELDAANEQPRQGSEENDFVKTFKESCEFTSGYGVAYQPNLFNWHPGHPSASSKYAHLFRDYEKKQTHLRTGRILTNATVTRVVDANTVHLEQEIPLNGAWRIYVFCGDIAKTSRAVSDFARYSFSSQGSYLQRHLRPDMKDVSFHERHNPHSRFFTFCSILASPHDQVNIDASLPDLLRRYRDHVYADDIWDVRVPEAKAAAHAKMGIDEVGGGVVVVRPDGYVGVVVGLEEGEGTGRALDAYFAASTEGMGQEGNGAGSRQARL